MSSTHSVVFFGTPDFAVPSLEAFVRDPVFDVQLVVTQPDKPVGRKKILTPPPVKVVADRYGIPVLQSQDVNHELRIKNQDCDYFVVVAYGQILSAELLKIPKIAAVNLHASLLPRWRGASPIQHAILAGDKETGVTVQQMVRELDAGPVLAQKSIPISARMTFAELHDCLKVLGADLLLDVLTSPLQPFLQDAEKATICKKLSRSDGLVDPGRFVAEDIDRRVRALNPWPGVTCLIRGAPVKLLETSLEELPDTYTVPCKNGSNLYLLRVQEPGRNPKSGAMWARDKK